MEDVIVFGKGRYYLSKKMTLREKYNVIGFIDNSVKENESGIFEGVKLLSPKNIEQISSTALIVIMSVSFIPMWRQLIEQGVEPKRILFATAFSPFYDAMEKMFYNKNLSFRAEENQIVIEGEEKLSFSTEAEYQEFLRKQFFRKDRYINEINKMPMEPVSRRFALERGTSIARYYIDHFIQANQSIIDKGITMEIADDRYTKIYAPNAEKRLILHVNGWGENVIKGDLTTGEGIEPESVDCLICTQTIQFIYDIHAAINNIHKLLKPGGYALITANFISQISLYDYDNWGEYWHFTEISMKKLCMEAFEEKNIQIESYGNMKTAIAFMYGLCVEDMKIEDIEYRDRQYPVIITAIVKKE